MCEENTLFCITDKLQRNRKEKLANQIEVFCGGINLITFPYQTNGDNATVTEPQSTK